MKNADMALYRAKAEGRASTASSSRRWTRASRSAASSSSTCASAIATTSSAVYQPLIDLDDRPHRRLRGAAALAPSRPRLVSPAEFIPIAEETGLIVPIGEWVLRASLRRGGALAGRIKVAVNLSAMQFKTPHLVETVRAALAASGLPPTRLELEITESVLLQDTEADAGDAASAARARRRASRWTISAPAIRR